MVHIPARAFVMACALSAALLVAGCGGRGGESAASGADGGEVFLQPVVSGGRDPFTASTAADSPFITRMPYPAAPANRGSARGRALLPRLHARPLRRHPGRRQL
ncbi:hypothetical protein HEP87_62160 [Streptomyces sp. S1D4-11]